MNVTVEAGVMTAAVSIVSAVVWVKARFSSTVRSSYAPVSTVRSLLRIGRSSLSAVPGDNNFMNGGLAVPA